MDPRSRFSDRVENYVSSRPGYPQGVLDILRQATALTVQTRIADVGSGTGLSAELFLKNGNTVIGVEPNEAMRREAERRLEQYPGFRSVNGSAEATTLESYSVDQVIAGQSFHWFVPQLAREEFARILEPGGWVVLMWNRRRLDSSPFLRAYEALLQQFGTDYREVQHSNVDLARLREFFAEEEFFRFTLYNEQLFDLDGLRARLLSSSYTPTATDPTHQPMLRELERVFEQHAEEGRVHFEYDVEIYVGHVTSTASA
ncbi:MAG TPA: class I SAM-dependent methyltransferase [Gemmatimonadaceae bacterium]|jgi:SAM-dependent methyltransferase|nr:class I SAM-dependent methyltransferase [Gemmatimonadaceae bacterium]